MHAATIEARRVTREQLRARLRRALPEDLARKRRSASAELVARARYARIMAERRLTLALERAERRYRETAELASDFDRRLGRARYALCDAGYLPPAFDESLRAGRLRRGLDVLCGRPKLAGTRSVA